MGVNQPYDLQLVYVKSCITSFWPPKMGNLHHQLRHLSAQPVKQNIVLLVALGFSQMHLVINIPESG